LLWLSSALLDAYRAGLVAGGHEVSSARMAGLANLVLADDPETAWPRIAPHYAYQRNSYNRYGAEGRTTASAGPQTLDATGGEVDIGALRQAAREAIPPLFDVVTAEEAIDRLTRWLAPLPASDVYLWESIAGMPDPLADRHVELVATRLAPALAHVGIGGPGSREASPARAESDAEAGTPTAARRDV
jgi:hypothetical protein